jgi:YHS domain-containing protein
MLSRHVALRAGAFAAVASISLMAYAQAPTIGVNWRTNIDAAMVEAAQSNRLVLLHFTTRTCGPCKALDQTVFNQPQVGAALEQDYVPVRVDADVAKALVGRYRIERVPTEIIVTPDGAPIASPEIPNAPQPYVDQLKNLAQHFRQTSTQNSVGTNPAYVGLSKGVIPAGAAAMQETNPPAPQAQGNPYMQTAANPQVHGQAQSIYAASSQQTAPAQQATATMPAAAQQQLAAPPQGVPGANAASAAVAQQSPTMPSNAMPRSYPSTETAPAAAQQTVAAQESPVKKPEQTDLPAGSPPLCFDGCCPVTLKTLNKWAYGNPQFGAVHRGRTYLFTGPQQREQFLAAPDAYSPVFAGKDPVLLLDNQVSQDGSRSFGFKYGEEFYLFSSKETMEKFKASPQTYAAGVRQAMSQLNTADGVVRR